MESTPNNAKLDKMLDEIDRVEDSIKSRDDLVAFIRLLIDAGERGAFDRISTFKYLDGLENRLFGIKGWCKNHNEPVPQQADWRWLGRMLTGAFY